eukprot:7191895-Alexandrium_andersonii.AAC.1
MPPAGSTVVALLALRAPGAPIAEPDRTTPSSSCLGSHLPLAMLDACRLGAARVVASTDTVGLPPGPPRRPASCLWRSFVHWAGLLAF